MSINTAACLTLLISLSIAFESNLTKGRENCFQVQPEPNSKENFIVNYQIPADDESLKVQLKNTDNFTLWKSQSNIVIEMRNPHELCFVYSNDGDRIVEMDIRKFRPRNSTYFGNLNIKAHWLMARLRNAAHLQAVEEYVKKIRIPGWVKVVLIVGIITVNTLIFRWWCNKRNKK